MEDTVGKIFAVTVNSTVLKTTVPIDTLQAPYMAAIRAATSAGLGSASGVVFRPKISSSSVSGTVLVATLVPLVLIFCTLAAAHWYFKRSTATDSFTYPMDRWNLDRKGLTIGHRMGGGVVGDVFRSKYFDPPRLDIVVAAKVCREDGTVKEKRSFLHEANVLKLISPETRCPNVVQLYGTCLLKEPLIVLLEWASHG